MSSHITIHNLSYRYPSQSEPIFESLNLHFSKGWTGIVGKNGSGKSTLAKIITRDLLPDEGKVLGYGSVTTLAQGTEVSMDELETFLDAENTEIGFWKSIFQLRLEKAEHYPFLSYGEKRRVLLAMALSKETEVLILDEPTNHLDAASSKLIRDAIFHYKGIGILISHDRDLLDGVISSCVFLEKNFCTQRSGNYSQGKQEMEREKEERLHNWEQTKRERKKLESELKRRRREASLSHEKRSKKGLDIHDHDGRYQKNLARVSGKDGQAGRLKNQIERRTEMSFEKEKLVFDSLPEKETIGIHWKLTPPKKKSYCLLDESEINLQWMNLFLPHHLEIRSDSRIAITGNNGSGKSSFLSYLVEFLLNKGIKTLYLPQELEEEDFKRLTLEFQSLSSTAKANVMSSLHRLGSDPKRFAASDSISPGEGKKLFLSLQLESEVEVIVLDEPTNHLDLRSVEALERSLKDWSLPLIMASHDRRFVETLANREWVLENFRLTEKHLDRI